MIRATLVLAGLFAASLAVERWLARDEERRNDSRGLIGRVVPADHQVHGRVAALRVESPHGERLLYLRGSDGWTLRDRPGLTDDAALSAFVGALLDAEGIVVSQSTDDARSYGVTSADAQRKHATT